jgi:predicted  nucleic acid-binding Zn-ribbon protein
VEIKPDVFKRSVESLLKLQDIDAQLFKFKSEVSTLPPELLQLQTKVADLDRAAKAADKQFRDIDRERRAIELRMLTLNEDIKRAEGKRRELRNTKEEFSANKEVENFQKKLAEGKAALDEKTAVATQKSQVRDDKLAEFSKLDAELKSQLSAREERLVSVKGNIDKLETQRDSFISQVDDVVFSLYERVQRIRKGSGLSLLKDGICTGCHVTIPPQTCMKLSRMNEIITCSSCSRILFPYEEVPEALRPQFTASAASAAVQTAT